MVRADSEKLTDIFPFSASMDSASSEKFEHEQIKNESNAKIAKTHGIKKFLYFLIIFSVYLFTVTSAEAE